MKLETWVDKVAKGRARTEVLQDLARVSGVSFQTLAQAERGARMTNYEKALAIQTATDGEITVVDLCDPNPETTYAIILRGERNG